MPEVHEITTYKFNELSDEAKRKAIEDTRNSEGYLDYDWWDCTKSDFAHICNLIGIDFTTRTIPLMGGGTRQEPCIYFRGFNSQGDGACFEGHYTYRKGFVKSVKDYAPQDETLHKIVDTLQALQRRYFYALTASMTHQGRYYHEHSMVINVEDSRREYGGDVEGFPEDTLTEVMRDLARWYYSKLDAEHDYLHGDEAIKEHLEANEYDFLEDGSRY